MRKKHSEREYRLVAQNALGRTLPDWSVVHHHGEGLVLCKDQAYHQLVHLRLRAYFASGNPNFRKCRYCKEWDDPSNLHIYGYYYSHQACSTIANRERNHKYQKLYYQKNKDKILKRVSKYYYNIRKPRKENLALESKGYI